MTIDDVGTGFFSVSESIAVEYPRLSVFNTSIVAPSSYSYRKCTKSISVYWSIGLLLSPPALFDAIQ